MKCSSCGGDFPSNQIQVIETSRYCKTCTEKLFAPRKASLGRKVSKSIQSSRKKSAQTPRAGRVSFIINSFVAWIAAPLLLSKVLPMYTNKVSHVNFGWIAGYELTLDRLLMGLIALIMSWFFTVARVKDVGWPILLSAIYCLPGPNAALFFWPGNRKENGYGGVPAEPSKLKKAFALFLICSLVAFVIVKMLG
ncbi:hypothetical protein ACFSJ3_04255 [Corallincola platygyrae]|uniref:DUF805 domain-containing protein n=1 Tax=Corallincola platygyrae TaxID=1193278 RepID=A0ABW4XKG7_9GAMM